MVDAIFTALWVYGGIGGLIAVAFLFWGMDRVDHAAPGAYAMRPLLLPGLVILWPLVLVRWTALARNRADAP